MRLKHFLEIPPDYSHFYAAEAAQTGEWKIPAICLLRETIKRSLHEHLHLSTRFEKPDEAQIYLLIIQVGTNCKIKR